MSTTDPLRLLLVDDHTVVRAGLRRVLEAHEGWTVVAEAAELDRALRATLGHKPDVVVLDLNLRGTSSLEAIPDFLARSPQSRIVVLTMQAEPAFARKALRDGASAYVLKEAAEEELVTAVRSAVAGHTYLTPRMGVLVATEASEHDDHLLSPREEEVLRLLALGHTNAEIAAQLYLSRRTIETHRANIQRKLDLSTRAELTRHAIDYGLLAV
jgi:two-component system, NarL family, response regulator NreC